MRVLVTGATGFTGRFVVAELLRRGHDVSAFVRDRERGRRLAAASPGVWIRDGDLDRPDSLRGALAGQDSLANVASLGFGHADAIVSAAESSGARRAIFFSTTAVFTTLDADSRAVRCAAEERIRASSLDWTILRPTMIYGSPDDRNVVRLIRWVERHRIVPVFGPGTYRLQPVFVADLAAAVAACLESPCTVRRDYDLSGGTVIDYNGLVRLVAALLGRRIRLAHLPVRLSLAAVALARRIPGLPRISREQVLRLNEHKDFPHDAAGRDFGFSPRELEAGLRDEIDELRARRAGTESY